VLKRLEYAFSLLDMFLKVSSSEASQLCRLSNHSNFVNFADINSNGYKAKNYRNTIVRLPALLGYSLNERIKSL
jgi:hypothetical protein